MSSRTARSRLASQGHQDPRSYRLRLLGSACTLLLGLATPLHAVDQPADFDTDVHHQEMMNSLAEVARTFGPDAVILQTALLNQAVRGGSILEARVDAPAFEDRDGQRYIAFSLESGIIYNDKDVSPEERVRKTWRDVVAAALHRLTQMTFKAQGVAVKVGYNHRPYEDERTLRGELPEHRGEAETTSYFILIDDAAGLVKGTADVDAVLQKSVVLRGTEVVRLP